MRKKWALDPEFRCQAVTKRGTRCRSSHQKNSIYCFWHTDPAAARAAASKGGHVKAAKPFEIHTNIRSMDELAAFLDESVERAKEALNNMEYSEHTPEKELAYYKAYIDSMMQLRNDPPPEP